MNILRILAIAVCLSVPLWAEDRLQLPVLVTKVDPDYRSLQTGYVADIAEIEVTLDARGVPFALKSSVGLPDNVVEALRQWRYEPLKKNGHASASLIKMTFPFRRAMTPVLERTIRPAWAPKDERVRQAIEAGNRLTGEEAARLDQGLAEAEALEHRRTSLLIYYSKGLPDAGKAREARARLITWLIEHYPDDEILGSPAAVINATGEPLADAEGQNKARQLWAAAVAGAPHNLSIAEHAIQFLQVADAPKAVTILTGLRTWAKCYAWLGEVYALQALGVKALDLTSGEAIAASDGEASQAAREGLLKATDGKAVVSAMETVQAAHFSLAEANLWTPAMQEFCGKFLAHTKEIYAGSSASCDVPAHDPNLDRPVDAFAGARGEAPRLRKRIEPKYPAEAKDQMVQGTVRLSAVIEENGRIQEVGLLEGPLALYGASRKAVGEWEFEPARMNGHAVAMMTQIEVNFSLRGR